MKNITLLLLLSFFLCSCFEEKEDSSGCPSMYSYSDPTELTLSKIGTSVRYQFRAIGYPTDYPTNIYASSHTFDGSIPPEGCVGQNKGIGSISSEYTSFDITNVPSGTTVTVRICNLYKIDSIFACPSAGIVESIMIP